MASSLGIDIGGTTTKVAHCTDAGEVLFAFEIPTPTLTKSRQTHLFAAQLAQECAVRQLLPAGITTLGIAVAGAINREGQLVLAPNVDINLNLLEKALGLAFPQANKLFLNDANAAALGEFFAGAAKDQQTALMLTLGTGVGAGLIIDGYLTEGAHGLAGELGHLCVQPNGAPCNCGKRGCLEQYASATALVRLYRERVEEQARENVVELHTAKEVLEAFANGDDAAAYAVGELCDKLAFALAQLACTVDPDVFVIGGGVSLGRAHFESLLKSRYLHHAGKSWENTPIVFARLGGLAGCIGAAVCALRG